MDVGVSFWSSTIGSSIINAVPDIIAWTIGIVLAVIMIKRGGLKPEKLLLTGCCLMLFTFIANLFLRELIYYLMSGKDVSYLSVGRTMMWVSVPMMVLSLSGVICLIWAFWIKFRVKNRGAI